MKAAVILNKDAGKKDSGQAYSSGKIKDSFQRLNITVEVFQISGDEIPEKVKECVEATFDVIIAAGGDGTISSIASELEGTKTALGILPFGTLNHFAKDNNIPLDFDEAIKVISENKIRSIDIVEVNGKKFINNSSIGIYPKVVKHRDSIKEQLGGRKWIAMLIAFINEIKKFSSIEVDVISKENKFNVRTPFVFIGNNNYQMNIFNLGTRERLDEGILTVYFPNTTGFFSFLRFLFLAAINKLKQAEDFTFIKAKEVTIITRRRNKKLDVSVDGEVIHLSPPLNYKIKAGQLKLLSPLNKDE
jgi:diacylglycerol kinase family enzyme